MTETVDGIIRQLMDYKQLNALALRGLPSELRGYAAGASETPPSDEAIASATRQHGLTEAQVAVATGNTLPGRSARETAYQAALAGLSEQLRNSVTDKISGAQAAVAQGRKMPGLRAQELAEMAEAGFLGDTVRDA